MEKAELIDTEKEPYINEIDNIESEPAGEPYEPEYKAEESEEPVSEEPDYESIIAEDLAALKSEFPELGGIDDITKIKNPLRYAALRDLGLTPVEAYLAARGKENRRDNRKHLCGTVPGAISAPHGAIPHTELQRAREIFNGMSDSEIQELYRRVTK